MSSESEGDAIAILCTAPDAVVAEALARAVVGARLAACVNILPAVLSVYRWDNEVKSDAEVLLIIKTTRERFESVSEYLRNNHPYDVPEIVALPIALGDPAYLSWLCAESR